MNLCVRKFVISICLKFLLIWGLGDGFFVFAKCNVKADAAPLVSYTDLVKKKNNLRILLAFYPVNFFLVFVQL